MTTTNQTQRPPSKWLLMMETRSIFELGAFWASSPLLNTLPKGDGHPVLVLPGFLASSVSTWSLRLALRSSGYAVYDWRQGRNKGIHPETISRLLDRIDSIYQKHQRKVSLVGWSLGGTYARELAKQCPDKIRTVISLGSPITGNPNASNLSRVYERVAGHTAESAVIDTDTSIAPPVPTTSIYSKTDGIVTWQCSIQQAQGHDRVENIEVESSHLGMVHNPSVFYLIADRLSQPENQWQPFAPSGCGKLLYQTPVYTA